MPLEFTCPHCGHQSNVADQYAGQSGPCAGCGQTITIPTAPQSDPSGTPPVATVAASPGSGGTSIALIVFAVAAFAVAAFCVIGILIALLLPAVSAAREAARRVQCTNNLQRISLAMLEYNEHYGTFPPAYLADEDGEPMHSWRVLLLPFLDHEALYQQYDFDEPWDGPNNRLLSDAMPAVYGCPSAVHAPGETHYLVIGGPGHIFDGDRACAISDITDGLENTILVVEAPNAPVNWMQPFDTAWNGSATNLGEAHPSVVMAALANGSVRAINVHIDTSVMEAMLTIDGDEDVSLDSWP